MIAEFVQSLDVLRGLGVNREPRRVLAAVAGVEDLDMSAQDECCGFGGLFSLKHADISSRMLERKMANVEASGAERLVSCDFGCLLHIGGGLHRRGSAIRVQHLAELVDEAQSKGAADRNTDGADTISSPMERRVSATDSSSESIRR